MNEKKHVVIQKRIDEVMSREFDKMIGSSSNEPLLKLILDHKLEKMSLEEIKKYLNGESNE